uniref:Uncharacterized protein n=1 Tax=Angiostrongylus cantonensis TaxID=6313 RepID=A0A0K0CTT8_ANGCA
MSHGIVCASACSSTNTTQTTTRRFWTNSSLFAQGAFRLQQAPKITHNDEMHAYILALLGFLVEVVDLFDYEDVVCYKNWYFETPRPAPRSAVSLFFLEFRLL